jgi:ankyrin repeat protein
MDVDLVRSLAQRHPEYLNQGGALIAATRFGRIDVVELLLDLGTPPDVKGLEGEQALHVTAWADSVPLARLLIERGADVDARDRAHSATPLSWAIYLGKPQLIDYLSTLSSDIFCLATAGKVERVRALLEAQPSLVKTLRDDQTLLYWLPAKDEDLAIEIAEVLLSHGADPGFTNPKGLTAADEAEQRGMDALAQVLRDAGPA